MHTTWRRWNDCSCELRCPTFSHPTAVKAFPQRSYIRRLCTTVGATGCSWGERVERGLRGVSVHSYNLHVFFTVGYYTVAALRTLSCWWAPYVQPLYCFITCRVFWARTEIPTAILDWRNWESLGWVTQGVRLRQIGEKGGGGGGGGGEGEGRKNLCPPHPLLHFARPNPLSSHEPKWWLRQRRRWI